MSTRDLQAGVPAHHFSRASDSAMQRAFVCRAKRREDSVGRRFGDSHDSLTAKPAGNVAALRRGLSIRRISESGETVVRAASSSQIDKVTNPVAFSCYFVGISRPVASPRPEDAP